MLNLQQLWLQKSCSQQLTQPTSESLCDKNRLPITADGLKIELGQSCIKRSSVNMRGSRKFCQSGSMSDNVFFVFFLVEGMERESKCL